MFFYNFNQTPTILSSIEILEDSLNQCLLFKSLDQSGNVISEFKFDPSTLRSHPSLGKYWTDHACWVIECRNSPGFLDFTYPLFPLTSHHGGPAPFFRPIFDRPILIYIPFHDSTIDEMSVMTYISVDGKLIAPNAQKADRRILQNQLLPQLKLISPAKMKSNATLQIQAKIEIPDFVKNKEKKIDVYLSSSAGYLPQRKIQVGKEGTQFMINSNLLQVDEIIEITAGFKYYPEKTFTQLTIES